VVIGIGLDLVEIARVERLLALYGERFVLKIMDADEAAALPREPAARAVSLARAVAGKEAASKALGTGWSQGVHWRDVVVAGAREGEVRLQGGAAAAAQRIGSDGRTRARFEQRDALAIGEVWLLA
jgi:holo-[acyl-carrier protein] synthase